MAKQKKATSKTKAKTANPTISAKQYGQNIVMIIDGEKYSRAFKVKEERDDMLLTVESYNAKPTKKLLNSILNTMSESKKKREKKAKEVKKAKKTLKKSTKPKEPKAVEATESELEKAKRILEENNYVVSKPAPRRRGGEY